MTAHHTVDLTAPRRARSAPVTATAAVPTAFADLICTDPDLLQLEFDSIIAANFPAGTGHPSSRPPMQPAALSTRQLELPRSTGSGLVGRPRRRSQPAYPRERSPPSGTESRTVGTMRRR